MNERIKNIRKYGKTARGQKELLKHLSGQRLTFKQAIYAKCYDCAGFFSDGKIDCECPACSLYPFMAYNKNTINAQHRKAVSGDQKETTRAAML